MDGWRQYNIVQNNNNKNIQGKWKIYFNNEWQTNYNILCFNLKIFIAQFFG